MGWLTLRLSASLRPWLPTYPTWTTVNRVSCRWTFKAVVYTSQICKGFVGYGDADPSNVSPLVHGAEMRVAETRAVNRALRKAYGIGICSVEELPSAAPESAQRDRARDRNL